MQPKVTIIILNYNGLALLSACLESLFKTTYSNFEVLVVDNASTDGSTALIHERYAGRVTLIKNKENRGFSKGNNQAIKLRLDSDYIVLLNNDTEVEPEWLTRLVDAADKDRSIGALQPKLKSMKDHTSFDYCGAAGGYLDRFGYTVCRGRLFYTTEKDSGQYDDACGILWAGGAAMFLRTSVLQEVGLLDEDFQAHFEEIDLCWRIILAGYKVRYVPSSVVYHLSGGTPNPKRVYLNQRNNLFTLLKNYTTPNLVKYGTGRVLFDCVNMGYALFRKDIGWAKAIVKSYLWLGFHSRIVLEKRREVQRLRKIGDDEVLNLMFPHSTVVQYFILGKKTYQQFYRQPEAEILGDIQAETAQVNLVRE